MRKTLRAIVAVLCVILALNVIFLIYLQANDPGSKNTSTSGQNASDSTEGNTADSEDTTAPHTSATTTSVESGPTFQTEDPTAVTTPEIAFPDEEQEQTGTSANTQSTTGVDTDHNATPDIDF